MDVYKSQSYLQDEIENLETLKPENLANKAVFSKGKNYFLQVVGNQEHTNEENEVTHQRVPEMAVMVYAITTLYYQVMGKYSIKRTPDEKKRPYKGFNW